MHNTIELCNDEVEVVVAALLSMSCQLCPLQSTTEECRGNSLCHQLVERVIGGELSEVYGLGGE